MELTKGAADNYLRSWWKRHGVVLDGEIAAVCFKHGNYDLAAKSYEKVCALYAGEGWQDLLAEVLPNLAECQKILNDQAGYLSSCVRLLSLDKGLFLTKERQAFQLEVVRLAHGEMKQPVPLDVSSLIMFSGNPGPPIELCNGDPGILSVTVWSGFPDDITLDSLSLTLMATFQADEGIKVHFLGYTSCACFTTAPHSLLYFRLLRLPFIFSGTKKLFCYCSKTWSKYNYLGFTTPKARFLCLGSSYRADWAPKFQVSRLFKGWSCRH